MRLQCEICGGDIIKKAENDFRCVCCGCIYPLDQLKAKVKLFKETAVNEETKQGSKKEQEDRVDENIQEADMEMIHAKVIRDFEKVGWERISMGATGISEDAVHIRARYYYIPATGYYFQVDGDGNYYHGYDLVFNWYRGKRELFVDLDCKIERYGLPSEWGEIKKKVLEMP